MATDFRGMPGSFTGNTYTPRFIFTNYAQVEYAPGFSIIDGTLSRDTASTPTSLLQAGTLLGKITSTGKYRPSIIGLTSGAISSGSATSVTVTAATATEVARLITVAGGNVSLKLVGPPTAGGTVASTAITCTAASGTTLTVSSVSLPAIVDGSLVVPADGSQTPVTLVSNPTGVDVVLTDGTSADQPLHLNARKADVASSKIVNYPADTATRAFLKAALKTTGLFTFVDDR